MQIKVIGFIVSIIFLVCATSLFFKEQILLAVGDYLVMRDELKPVDVIHVIAGDDYRTDYAIQLYKQGLAKHIFFTGGLCQIHWYFHGEHGQQLALSQGVSQEAIAFDDSSVTSTYSETVRLKAWIDQSPVPIRSVIVVSDPFHMRRASWTYQHVLGDEIRIQMVPVPFGFTPYTRFWWTEEASRLYVKNEYLKILYYYGRYQFAAGPIKDWWASFDVE